jgi:hypothetical protein
LQECDESHDGSYESSVAYQCSVLGYLFLRCFGEEGRRTGSRGKRYTDIPPDKKVASRPIFVVFSNLMFHTIGIGRTSMTTSVTMFGTLAKL